MDVNVIHWPKPFCALGDIKNTETRNQFCKKQLPEMIAYYFIVSPKGLIIIF